MENDYIYVFLHLPKCAGTTLTYHVQCELDKSEYISVYHNNLDFTHTDVNSRKEVHKTIFKYIKASHKKNNNKTKIIFGHHIPFEVHNIFNKKCRYVTFFRNPIDRTISLYNYWVALSKQDPANADGYINLERDFFIKSKTPKFGDWLEEKYGFKEYYYSKLSLTNHLQLYNYLPFKKLTVDEINNSLNKFYFIGHTDYSKEDLMFILNLFKITRVYKNKNITKKKYVRKDKLDKGTMSLLNSKNKQDLIMEKYILKSNKYFKKNYNNFDKLLEKLERNKHYVKEDFSILEKLKSKIKYLD